MSTGNRPPVRLTPERTALVVIDLQERFRGLIHGMDQVFERQADKRSVPSAHRVSLSVQLRRGAAYSPHGVTAVAYGPCQLWLKNTSASRGAPAPVRKSPRFRDSKK